MWEASRWYSVWSGRIFSLRADLWEILLDPGPTEGLHGTTGLASHLFESRGRDHHVSYTIVCMVVGRSLNPVATRQSKLRADLEFWHWCSQESVAVDSALCRQCFVMAIKRSGFIVSPFICASSSMTLPRRRKLERIRKTHPAHPLPSYEAMWV